jgi:phage terminase small subunit
MLNPKQEAFCQQYIIDMNATQAAKRAGYSKKTARQHGARLLTDVHISKRIQELKEEAAKRNELTADDIIQELKALGFWSIKDFLNKNNSCKDLSTLDKKILRPVVGIKVTELIINKRTREVKTELKLADKRAALVDLGRHIGIFEKDNEQKSIKIKVTRK